MITQREDKERWLKAHKMLKYSRADINGWLSSLAGDHRDDMRRRLNEVVQNKKEGRFKAKKSK